MSAPWTEATWECIAGHVADMLTGTAEVRHRTETQDAGGGTVGGYPTDPDIIVPAMLQARTGRILNAQGRIVEQTFWNVLVPLGTDIRPQDRITIDGRVFQHVSDDHGQTIATHITISVVLFE